MPRNLLKKLIQVGIVFRLNTSLAMVCIFKSKCECNTNAFINVINLDTYEEAASKIMEGRGQRVAFPTDPYSPTNLAEEDSVEEDGGIYLESLLPPPGLLSKNQWKPPSNSTPHRP